MEYVIWCQVSGGVTGTRTSTLKGRDGQELHFATREEAQAEADRLTRLTATVNSPANFRYWVEQMGTWSV